MTQNDNRHIETEQSLCPFKLLTGFPCPGCGITKSMIFLYEGDFLKSIYYSLLPTFTRMVFNIESNLKSPNLSLNSF